MQFVNKWCLWASCLIIISGSSWAGTIREPNYIATGTAGGPGDTYCTAELVGVVDHFGHVDFGRAQILANPFTLNITCGSPQKVKFKFVDNISDSGANPDYYTLRINGEGAVATNVMYRNLQAKAGGADIRLYADQTGDETNLVEVNNLINQGSMHFGNTNAKASTYQVSVGEIAFADLEHLTIPDAEKEVHLNGTFVIEYDN